MVKAKHSAEACAAGDFVPVASRGVGLDQFVSESLVVSLAVIVGDLLVDGVAEMHLAEKDDPVEALLFDRANEPFDVRVCVRRLVGREHDLRPRLLKALLESGGEFRIAVAEEEAAVEEKTIDGIGEVSGDLFHEIVTKRWRTCGEVNTPRGHLHDEKQIIRHQAAFRPDFNGREIDGCQYVPMRLDERRPRCLSLPVGSRFDPVLFENVSNSRVGYVVANVGQLALNTVVRAAKVVA